MKSQLPVLKKTKSTLLWLGLVLSILFPALAETSSKAELNQAALQLVKNFEQTHKAQVGVSTLVLKSGKVPFSYRATQPMIPASNLKVVTTAVALDRLGPRFRFETKLYGSAKQKNGVLEGDLVLKAGGDPSFFPPLTSSDSEPFQSFARVLKRGGVRAISGNLVIDDSSFDREFISDSYLDRYLLDSYAAPFGGLSLNRNVVTLNVTSDSVTTTPSSGSLNIKNKVDIGSGNQIWAERKRGTDDVTVHGVVAPGSTAQTTITVGDPVRFAASACHRILNSAGISIPKWRLVKEGKAESLSGKVLLARHRSPTLDTLIARTNRESDNILAQHIFRRLGASGAGFGSVANSEAVVKDFFEKHKIDTEKMVMDDGSGLSEKNQIAPFQLVRLLEAMWGHPRGQIFIDSLPGPGEGTLRSRLSGMSVKAKSGTLQDHSALTGYVVTAHGQTVGFSVIVNNTDQTWSAVELQDKLVSLLANWNREI